MLAIHRYFILKANNADALAAIVSQAIRNGRKQPLGHPFSIVRPDGSAFAFRCWPFATPERQRAIRSRFAIDLSRTNLEQPLFLRVTFPRRTVGEG